MGRPEMSGIFMQIPEKTNNRPYEVYPKTFNIKCNVEVDTDWQRKSKRRLNTNRILPKSKRNKNTMRPWQSYYKRSHRNKKIWERILAKSMASELLHMMDKEIISGIVKIYGTNNEV